MSGSALTPHDPKPASGESPNTVLHYYLHDTGIHEFRFLVPSHRAVDAWADKLEAITRTTPANETMCYVFDLTEAGIVPFSHAYRRVQGVIRSIPDRPKTRAAVIHPPNFMTALVDTFVQLLQMGSFDEVRCFRASERNRAIEWLLEDDD